MTRRRLYTGLAAGTLFLPACSSLAPQTAMTPFRPNGAYPPNAGRPMIMPNPNANPNAMTASEELFAAERQEATPMGVVRNLARPLPGEMTPAPAEKSQIETVLYREKPEEPLITTPRVHPSAAIIAPVPEPVTDAGGVVRPDWPVIRGPVPFTVAPPANAPLELPRKITQPGAPLEIKDPVRVPPAVLNPPASGNESIIGSSVPPLVIPPASSPAAPVIDSPPAVETIAPAANTERSAPTITIPNYPKNSTSFILPSQTKDEIPPAMPVIQPISAPGLPAPGPQAVDTPLIQAVRAFQQNKPQEALEYLKSYDQPTQQVLISIMPALVQLSEGKLLQMKREEMDLLLEQLTRVPPMLRPRASLQANKLLLCREVHKFAHVDPFPVGNEYRPGDMVYLYAEISNFSCVPDTQGGYSVALGSHLELLDQTNAAVWKADPKEEPERVSTPPQDYYRAYRFCVPSSLAPGKYSLLIRLTDKPTGRETTKSVEFRVGAK